ncbi:hypothetical protein WA026_013441 [Henosepilachna vigintioctopunctata]|uniref:Uncharacterized protein n=1 Tax=Henosepilachna vigintioctopunctata TaxID=420089 RepID=A0AAW1VG79_9CUCU
MNFAERCESFISQNKFVDASELIKCEIAKKSNSYDIKELNVAQFLRCEYLTSQEQSIFLLEFLRYLRNSTTTLENQQFLTENECFLQKLKVLFNQLMEQNNSEVLMKVILQLLVNIIVSNKESSSKVYTYFYDNVLECFYRKYNKYEVLALLYNIHLQNSYLPLNISLCEGVLDEAIDSSCEFAEFLIELFLSSVHFWSLYKKFDINKKILILQALQNMLITRHTKDIPELALQTLSEVFSESTSIIFQTMSCSTDSLEPYEISLVLEILGCLCGHEKYLRFLQNDKELIIRVE